MITYIKLGQVRGISLEINRNLGLKPFFRKNSFHHETIIDIPYAQFIYTSGRWYPKKRVPIRSAANINEKTNKITKNTKRANER